MTTVSPNDHKTLDDVIGRLRSWKRPIIVGHVVPDADCLASIFSVAKVFGRNGSTPKVALPKGSVSQRLAFMVEAAKVPVATAADFAAADGFVALDTAKKPRCNVGKEMPETWSEGRELINIDHHATNTRFGQLNWVIDNASSCAEMVHALIRRDGHAIDPTLAMLLYCGVHSDTGGFSLPGTSPSALEAAADLVRCGAKVEEIGERLCRSQKHSEFSLLKAIYANTQLHDQGRIAYSTASHAEITGAGCTAADIDEQVNVPRSLQGIRMAILFSEGNAGKIRMNFRGEGGLNILPLATSLGGGGHRESAGAVVDGTMKNVVDRVLTLAVEYLRANP